MAIINLTKDNTLKLKDPERGGSILPFRYNHIEKARIAIEPQPIVVNGGTVNLKPEAFTFCCQSGANERTRIQSVHNEVIMHDLDSAAIIISHICIDTEDLPIVLDNDRNIQISLGFRLTCSRGRSRMLKSVKNDKDLFKFDITLNKIDCYADISFEFENRVYEQSNLAGQAGMLRLKHSSSDPLAPVIKIDSLQLDTELNGKHIDSDLKVTFIDGSNVLNQNITLRPDDTRPFEIPLFWKPMWDNNPQPGEADTYIIGATCAHGDNIDYNKGEMKVRHNPAIVNFNATISIPTRNGRKVINLLHNNKNEYVPRYELDTSTNGITIGLEFASSAAETLRPSAIVWDLQAGAPAENAANRMVMTDGMKPTDAFALVKSSDSRVVHIRRESSLLASININPRHFKKIIPDERTSSVEVTIPISFKCCVDHKGDFHDCQPTDNFTTHTFNLRMMLRMRPDDNWLSIDFGTSAIVARYQNRLLNLKDNKIKLYRLAYPSDKNKQKVTEPANLINSSICFNRASTAIYTPADKLATDTFKNLQLHLSPSAGTFDVSAQLPCLKLLMGYKSISDIFDSGTLKQFNMYKPDGSDACLMEISNIFELVYRQLFNLYISNLKIEKINRLILSVPNTYTPIQVSWLRRIARHVFTEAYPEHLDTISESDAVAYYYAANRENFKGHNPDLEKESVLIYDMGAGTLDITYLTITRSQDKTTVDVKGKSGTAMAGNYIDYVLAQAFVELCAERGAITGPSLNNLRSLLDINDTNPDVRTRSALREFMRNIVKPAISSANNTNLDIKELKEDGKNIFQILSEFGIRNTYGQTDAKPITIGDLAFHPCFTDCLKAVTSDLLSDFAKRHNINLQSDVDTIIFSGRSSLMTQIRQMVKETLHPGARYANLGTKSLEEELKEITDNEAAILKNIVSEGTIAYANLTHQQGHQEFELKRKTFYATYGVIIQGENGTNAQWIPFRLQPDPMVEGCFRSTIKVCISNKCNFLRLVQTYTSNPLGNDSMTTNLYSSRQNNGDMTISLKLDPSKENLLCFEVGPTEIALGARAQDINSPTLRKSLWPIVFETKY